MKLKTINQTAIVAALILAGGTSAAYGQSSDFGLALKSSDGALSRPAPDLATTVDMTINGLIARVKVRQTYINSYPEWQEGIYRFPLPSNAAVDSLQLQIGDRVIDGVIKEKQAAKATYVRAKQSGQRAGLVEQNRPNIFTTSIANIGPDDTVTVEIGYQQPVTVDDNLYSIRLPLTITPRYDPAPRQAGIQNVSIIQPVLPVETRSRADGRANPVSFDIKLDTGMNVGAISSTYHTLGRTEKLGDGRYRIKLDGDAVPADRDFELAWALGEKSATGAAIYSEMNEAGYHGMVLVTPPAKAQQAPPPREVIVVLDISGSMAGTSIEQAKQSVARTLSALRPEDRFNLVHFSDVIGALHEESVPATPAALIAALSYLSHLAADGGTEIVPALGTALSTEPAHGFLRQVVFITDGAVSNETEFFQKIADTIGDARLFTVSIGSAPNRHLMERAADLGRGAHTTIGRSEEVMDKMNAFLSKLNKPILTDLKILWPAGYSPEVYPEKLPDLYLGEPLELSFRSDMGLPGPITIAGQMDGKPWFKTLQAPYDASAEGVAKLWAQRRLNWLESERFFGLGEDDLRASATETALGYGLTSKYTSLVAVDRTPARPETAPLHTRTVPQNPPAGSVVPQAQKRATISIQNASATIGLPQTATPSLRLILAGLALVLASLFAWHMASRLPARMVGGSRS